MKRLLSLIALTSCTGLTAMAQDLAYKIPEKAFSVGAIKGNQLFRLASVKEISNSVPGQKLLAKLSKGHPAAYTGLDELGFNLSANTYFYYHMTDSIDYTTLIIPIADKNKVEKLLLKYLVPVSEVNGVKTMMDDQDGDKTIKSWNNEMLVLTSGHAKASFFSDSATAARYGIDPDVRPVYVEADTAAVAAPYEDSDEVLVDSAVALIDTAYAVPDIMDVPTAVPDDAPPPPMLPDSYQEDAEEQMEHYKQQEKRKDSLSQAWLVDYSRQVFDKKEGSSSILNVPGFKRANDPEAVASFWMTDIQSMYASFLPYSLMKYGYGMKGYGTVNARLYMDKEHMRMTTEIGLDENKSAIYNKICNHQLNKKFFKYINSDSLVGFMSYAYNTEAYLNEIPKMFTGIYARYDEEMMIAGDMISLLLDEKAVAKVIKGDALFLLSGISEKQVTYSSYVYDQETFEYKDTVRTKTETLPDFLLMFSSDDASIIERLLQYAIRKEKAVLQDGIYSFEQTRKMPLSLHLLIKDGIVFMGTSRDELTRIQNGTFKANVTKEQKQLLTKNNFSLFFNPRNMGQVIPTSEVGETAERLRKLMNGAGNVYMTSTGIKDGYIGVDMTADVPKEKENALKYFLEMMEEMNGLK